MKKEYVRPQVEEIRFCPEEELMGGVLEPEMGTEILSSGKPPWIG